jgi:hypothetical protein
MALIPSFQQSHDIQKSGLAFGVTDKQKDIGSFSIAITVCIRTGEEWLQATSPQSCVISRECSWGNHPKSHMKLSLSLVVFWEAGERHSLVVA